MGRRSIRYIRLFQMYTYVSSGYHFQVTTKATSINSKFVQYRFSFLFILLLNDFSFFYFCSSLFFVYTVICTLCNARFLVILMHASAFFLSLSSNLIQIYEKMVSFSNLSPYVSRRLIAHPMECLYFLHFSYVKFAFDFFLLEFHFFSFWHNLNCNVRSLMSKNNFFFPK